MAPHHRRRIGARRRRIGEDGEEDEFVDEPVDDDSLSDATVSSHEDDDDLDGAGSEPSVVKPSSSPQTRRGARRSRNGKDKHPRKGRSSHAQRSGGQKDAIFESRMAETEAMMNGMKLAKGAEQPAEIHFDDMKPSTSINPDTANQEGKAQKNQREAVADRKRREHEQYVQKRDSDPSFVPTRGGFFLHDNRFTPPSSSNGFRSNNKLKGKPHGLIVDSNIRRRAPPNNTGATGVQWRHDLHDSINQETKPGPVHPLPPTGPSRNPPFLPSNPVPTAPRSSPPNRSFSSTVLIGNVPVVVFLPGMANPIPYQPIAKRQYTRLPQHRPPLRRDKPVRVSLPGQQPRYIFPAVDRSFIFIPRALRPNQQYRGRGRGGYFSSRKTSVYSGSVYTPSVAMSRRSSFGREPPYGGMYPNAPTPTRPIMVGGDMGRPIVRLPPQPPVGTGPVPVPIPIPIPAPAPISNVQPPMAAGSAPPTFFVPQNPPFRETRPDASMPMHQPRPQKSVVMADIEPPAAYSIPPPIPAEQQQQQHFQPIPQMIPGQPFVPDPSSYHHPLPQQPSYPPSMAPATPLSQAQERAIHAIPFQPDIYQPPQTGYGTPIGYPPGPILYPAPNAEYAGHNGHAPPYAMGVAVPYGVQPPPSAPLSADQTAPAGMVAHESNGMVYYYDTSQLPTSTYSSNPPPYAVPPQGGVLGMGGSMTPPGSTYYYPSPSNGHGPMYYP
ncbi:hypothetical protein FQN57_005633 [Myotisia sp. PD_48]|nr:hypothetical protein FQN57_005633 [Myotisia sp. PD_48]